MRRDSVHLRFFAFYEKGVVVSKCDDKRIQRGHVKAAERKQDMPAGATGSVLVAFRQAAGR